MIALDTSIIVRIVVLDEPRHVEKAKQLMTDNICYITCSVIQEVVWVLSKLYKMQMQQIASVLDMLLFSEDIVVEEKFAVSQAVLWYQQGFDFADALHLATAGKVTALATFDQVFIKAAATAQTLIPVNHP